MFGSHRVQQLTHELFLARHVFVGRDGFIPEPGFDQLDLLPDLVGLGQLLLRRVNQFTKCGEGALPGVKTCTLNSYASC